MNERIQAYNLYKNATGLTTYKNFTFPNGNTNFWQKAAFQVQKVEEEEVGPLIYDEPIDLKDLNNIMEGVVRGQLVLSETSAKEMYNLLQTEGRYVMKMIDENGIRSWITINHTTREYFIGLITKGKLIKIKGAEKSDAFDEIDLRSLISAKISELDFSKRLFKIKKGKKKRKIRVIKNKDGSFFPFINASDIDLKKYQIFNKQQIEDQMLVDTQEHCLIHVLKEYNIANCLINQVKLAFAFDRKQSAFHIKKKDLKMVADIIEQSIHLHYYDSKIGSRTSIQEYNTKDPKGEVVHIAIYENHYFKFEETKYSIYSIDNYENLKDIKDFWNIYKNHKRGDKFYYERHETKSRIKSLTMVRKLYDSGYFIKGDLSMFTESIDHKELKDNVYLDNIQNEQRICERPEPLEKTPPVFWCDTETFVNTGKKYKKINKKKVLLGKKHKLMMIGLIDSKSNYVEIRHVKDEVYQGKDKEPTQLLVWEWLRRMTSNGRTNAVCYFHFLKYDLQVLEPYLNIINKCQQDGELYSCTVLHNKKQILLKDSLKLMPFKLSEFSETFDLPEGIRKKEAISYVYYTSKNYGKRCDIDVYLELLSKTEQGIFMKNLEHEKSYKPKERTFDPVSYYKDYLRLDCLTLKKGFRKFQKLIKKVTNNQIDICQHLTISSLTDFYMKLNGAFDEVYEMTGNLRKYVGLGVHGGRVHVNANYLKKVIKGKISNYDGVSLYPSAIYRLCKEMGLPKGNAKRIRAEDFKLWNIKNYDKMLDFKIWNKENYGIMTVKITKVNKTQQMPFIHEIDENGTIQYTNEVPAHPVIIDSITIEDWVDFHKIEYEILDGIYYNSGYNKKMGDLVYALFQERRKQQIKENDAASNALKLMLNSVYGKTIQKKHNTKIKIVKVDKNSFNKGTEKWSCVKNHFLSTIYNNFNTVKGYRKINKLSYEVEMTKIDTTYNRGHVGVAILSMSKRIMNEVFDCANSKKCVIYYTDTDSLHCNKEDIKTIENEYYRRYKKVLNGLQLGQFHQDFKLKGAAKNADIYAIKSIFLGKKSYCDYLQSVDKNDEIINKEHSRMKGMTKEGLTNHAKKYSKDKKTPDKFKMYEDFSKGLQHKVLLNPRDHENNSQKVLFNFYKGNIYTKPDFYRTLKF